MTLQKVDQLEKVTEFFSLSSDYWRNIYMLDPGQEYSPYAYPYQKRMENALRLLQKHAKKDGCILDAGCGSGILCLALAKLGYQVQGIDLVPEMVAQANTLLDESNSQDISTPNLSVKFDVASIGNLPFLDNSFDAIISLGVLEYMDDPTFAVRELARVMKPNGIAIISFPNSATPLRSINKSITSILSKLRDIQILRWLKYRIFLRQNEIESAVPLSGTYRHQSFNAKQVKNMFSQLDFTFLEDCYQVYGIRISDIWFPIPFAIVKHLETLNQWPKLRHLGNDYIVAFYKEN